MAKKKVKNDTYINFRLPSQLKIEFINRCEELGEHYQTQLKKMMKEFIDTPIKDLEQRKREQYLKTERLL